jgi:hypothetical protein
VEVDSNTRELVVVDVADSAADVMVAEAVVCSV